MENFYEIDLKVVGARIRSARRELGLTQEKAAELSFITGQFWSLEGDEAFLALETLHRNERWHLLFPHDRD